MSPLNITTHNSNIIDIFYQNTNSLKRKTMNFYLNVLSEDHDVIVITESWLSYDITNNEVFDARYDVYRQDRVLINEKGNEKRGGGILFAIKKTIQSNPIPHMNIHTPNLETLWVKCKIFNQEIYFCVCYFPPPVKTNTLKTFIEQTCSQNNLINANLMFIGDFNLKEYGHPDQDNSTRITELNKLTNFFNLESYNQIKNKNSRTLDLCLTNLSQNKLSKNKITNIQIEKGQGLVPPVSDHPPLSITISLKSTPTPNTNKEPNKTNLNYNRAEFFKIKEEIKQINWYNLLECEEKSTDEKLELFYNKINEITNKYVPKSKNKKIKFPIWWTFNTQKLFKQKERLRKIKNKSNKQKDKYQKLRKDCKKKIREDYSKYLEDMSQNIKKDSTQFWKYYKTKRKLIKHKQ
uniref:Endonuclease/exonuclease/phosphatase domain-containing protein n=1 Tax=Cacopsylla melanoneura TaxID=428564 RepID=A0A8D8QFL3_9HEMI